MKQFHLSRREVREKALQTLFQLKTNDELSRESAMKHALLSESEEDIQDLERKNISPYLTELVDGVLDHREAIENAIRPFLKNWTLERLAKTDAIIMEIAAYEILFGDHEEVPEKVALNEAIELAKKYGDEKSSRFINGVLSNLVAEQTK